MSSKKKGFVILCKEWAKHLKPYGRRLFWSSHRKAEQREINKQLSEV